MAQMNFKSAFTASIVSSEGFLCPKVLLLSVTLGKYWKIVGLVSGVTGVKRQGNIVNGVEYGHNKPDQTRRIYSKSGDLSELSSIPMERTFIQE